MSFAVAATTATAAIMMSFNLLSGIFASKNSAVNLSPPWPQQVLRRQAGVITPVLETQFA